MMAPHQTPGVQHSAQTPTHIKGPQTSMHRHKHGMCATASGHDAYHIMMGNSSLQRLIACQPLLHTHCSSTSHSLQSLRVDSLSDTCIIVLCLLLQVPCSTLLTGVHTCPSATPRCRQARCTWAVNTRLTLWTSRCLSASRTCRCLLTWQCPAGSTLR
jgi:hypothetical protein